MRRGPVVLAALVVLAIGRPVVGQATKRAPAPRSTAPALTSVVPPGATVGQNTTWVVAGTNLKGPLRWIISGDGVEVVDEKLKPDGTEATLTIAVSAGAEPGVRELRALGSEGISNLVLVRIDTLPQVAEVEPNDSPNQAQEIATGQVIAGTLRPQDRDCFRIASRAGEGWLIEIESRRLGIPLSPVVIIRSERHGAVLATIRETPGLDGDGRAEFVVPEAGRYLIEVRDAVYAGADRASYRLRIEKHARFATAVFPLAGRSGETVNVTACGGNLDGPLTQELTLPDSPGETLTIRPFGSVSAPARMAVYQEPVLTEPRERLEPGCVLAGRLDQPGERDRFRLALRKDQRVSIKVRAATLGSWLDSVLTLRDAQDAILAENDDEGQGPGNQAAQQGQAVGLSNLTDSRLDYQAKADSTVVIEVADRFGGGGPEYGYVLEVGSGQADFSVSLLIGAGAIVVNQNRPGVPPGLEGALNLKPGTNRLVNFQVATQGETGPIEVSAEGLPPGVTAAPVVITPNPIPRGSLVARANQFKSGSINLKVDPKAEPVLGSLKVVARSQPKEGVPLRRVAQVSLPISTLAVSGAAAPVVRTFSELPIVITGSSLPEIRLPEPPATPSLPAVIVPGVLLQGGHLDLTVGIDPKGNCPWEAHVEAKGIGVDSAGSRPDRIRLTAQADSPPGLALVQVRFTGGPGLSEERSVPVIVRRPFEIRAEPGPVQVRSGGLGRLGVSVNREPGFSGPVELVIEGLPEEFQVRPGAVVPGDRHGAVVFLTRRPTAAGPGGGAVVRVVGIARLGGTIVRVESPVQTILGSVPAEE